MEIKNPTPPTALRIIIPLLGLASLIYILFGISPPVLPKNISINNIPLPEIEFQNTWILAVLGVLGAILTFGLYKAKTWSRHLAVAWPFISLAQDYVIPAPTQPLIGRLIQSLILSIVVYWYFFKKQNVDEYFKLSTDFQKE